MQGDVDAIGHPVLYFQHKKKAASEAEGERAHQIQNADRKGDEQQKKNETDRVWLSLPTA